MAANLSNLVVPTVMGDYIAATLSENVNVITSGAARRSEYLSNALRGGANIFTVPFWNPISGDQTVPSSDPEVKAPYQRMSAGKQKAVRIFRANKPVAITDVEAQLTATSPIAEAARQMVQRLQLKRQDVLASIINGVVGVDGADAGTAGDLIYEAGSKGIVDAIVDGIAEVWGDSGSVQGSTLILGSKAYAELQKVQLSGGGISDMSGVNVGFGTFLGATLIRNDRINGLAVIRPDGLAYGDAAGTYVAYETERDMRGGNGGGVTMVTLRDLYTFHIAGTSFIGEPAGELATDAELASSANWALVTEPKFAGVMKINRT